MAVSGADDGHFCYLHGAQGHRLDPASGLPSLSRGGNHRGTFIMMWMPFVSWQSVAMFSLMSLKMSMPTD